MGLWEFKTSLAYMVSSRQLGSIVKSCLEAGGGGEGEEEEGEERKRSKTEAVERRSMPDLRLITQSSQDRTVSVVLFLWSVR